MLHQSLPHLPQLQTLPPAWHFQTHLLLFIIAHLVYRFPVILSLGASPTPKQVLEQTDMQGLGCTECPPSPDCSFSD